MFSSKLEAAKAVGQIVLSSCVSKVVHDVIAENVTTESFAQRAQVWVGTIALSAVATDRCWKHAENQIEKTATTIREFKAEQAAATEVQ